MSPPITAAILITKKLNKYSAITIKHYNLAKMCSTLEYRTGHIRKIIIYHTIQHP